MSNAFAKMFQTGNAMAVAPTTNALAQQQVEWLGHKNAMAKLQFQGQQAKNVFAQSPGGRNALADLATGKPGALNQAIEAGAPYDMIAEVQGIRDSDIVARTSDYEFASAQLKNLQRAMFGIEQLPYGQRGAAYQQLRQQYAGMNMDVSSWPAQYGPAVTATARQIPEAAKILDARIAGVKAAPGGGAGGGQGAPTYRTDLHRIVDENLIPSEGTGSNPNSSARGIGQFIDSTWLEEFKKAYPELAEPLSDAQILALRDDPEIARGVTHHYAANTVWPAFQAIGIQNPTPGQIKLGHMGPGRIKAIYTADDNAPITDVVEAEALAANPQWQGLLTVGDLKRWAEDNQAQYGAGSAGAQAGVQGNPQGGGQPQFLVTGSGVIATDGAPKGYGHTTTGVAPLPGYQSGPPSTTGLDDGYQWQQGQGGQWGAAPIPGHPMEVQGSNVLGQGNATGDRAYNTLTEQFGHDPETLAKVEAGLIKTFVDPLTKQPFVIDLSDPSAPVGQAVQPGGGQAVGSGQQPSVGTSQSVGRGPFPANGQAPVQMDPQHQSVLQQVQVADGAPTLFDLAEDTAGLGSWLENAATRVGGMFDLGGFPQTTSARQYVKAAQQQLITALSINARNPVAEQERLREQIDLDPQIFDSTEALQARQVAVDQLLRQKLASEQRIADDLNQSPQARRQAQMKAASIQQFLAILGVPPVIRTKEQYNALPEGVEYWHATESEVRIKGAQ